MYPGTVVANRYRIMRPLGRGGMGEVFAAENIRTGRPVAVKLLHAESKLKRSAVERFRREARAAGSINSDHVTQVLDVEEDQEHGIVLVFELLEGESLIDRLKRTGPIPFEELHSIVEQVWIGLVDAHKAGIVHRDLKPSNVFLEHRPDGTVRVKILDFGISKVPKEMGGDTLTEMGQSLGTFSFMPPEQIGKAKTVDHRADIYAGTTLVFQALSGQLPYAARNLLLMVEMKTKSDARKLADAMGAAVDSRLEQFLAIGLARDPNRRYQTALEALNAWRDLRPMDPPTSPRRSSTSTSGMAAVRPSSAPPSPGRPGDTRPDSMPAMLASELTHDSSAATLALPLSQIRENALGLGGTTVMETAPSITSAASIPEAHEPGVPSSLDKTTVYSGAPPPARHGGTQPISAAPPAPSRAPISAALPAPSRAPISAALATPPRAPISTALATPPRASFSAQPISSAPLSPTRASFSGAQPANARPATPARAPRSGASSAPLVRAAAPKKSALHYTLGALAFALVGFGIVAFVLQYLGRGTLRWH